MNIQARYNKAKVIGANGTLRGKTQKESERGMENKGAESQIARKLPQTPKPKIICAPQRIKLSSFASQPLPVQPIHPLPPQAADALALAPPLHLGRRHLGVAPHPRQRARVEPRG